MATHSSILAWEIPRTEEPGQLQPMGSQRVRPNLATKQQQEKFLSFLRRIQIVLFFFSLSPFYCFNSIYIYIYTHTHTYIYTVFIYIFKKIPTWSHRRCCRVCGDPALCLAILLTGLLLSLQEPLPSLGVCSRTQCFCHCLVSATDDRKANSVLGEMVFNDASLLALKIALVCSFLEKKPFLSMTCGQVGPKAAGGSTHGSGRQGSSQGVRRKADVWLHLLFCNVGENCLLSSGLAAPRS